MFKQLAKRIPAIRDLVAERDMLRAALTRRGNAQDDSFYYDEANVVGRVVQGQHREAIGGLWDEVGDLQFRFLVDHGLKPEHHLLDVGCGALRGGVRFIPFLNPGNYWGVDLNEALIEAGWTRELGPAGLQERQPRQQLVCLKDFEFDTLNRKFDMALAVSVFTHLNLNTIRRCLRRIAPVMTSGGRFFATFFEVPAGADAEAPQVQVPNRVTTTSTRDPFHYRVEDFQFLTSGLPLTVHYHGEWQHDRNQKMLVFEAA